MLHPDQAIFNGLGRYANEPSSDDLRADEVRVPGSGMLVLLSRRCSCTASAEEAGVLGGDDAIALAGGRLQAVAVLDRDLAAAVADETRAL